MKWISDVLAWINANQAVLIPIVGLILTSILNGLVKYPGEGANLARIVIGFLLDRLSFNTNRNSPNTLKLPIVMGSKAPHACSSSSSSSSSLSPLSRAGFVHMALLGVLAAALIILMVGCALLKAAPSQLLNCEETQTQWSGLVNTVGTDLRTGSWDGQTLLDSLLTTEGPAVVCAVESVIGDLTSGPPAARTAAEETQLVIAEAWLASEGHAKLVTHTRAALRHP